MLEVLRRKGVNKTILWFIAVVVILSFGVFGTAYRLDNTINSAGTMFGHSVSFKDFRQAYEDARDQAIRVYGEEFFKRGSVLDLEQEAWDRLILLREARQRKIRISDEEVVAYIASLPVFQRRGQFDPVLYDEIVQNSSVFDRSTHDFEEGVRKQLMIKKLIDDVAPDAPVTESELKKIYQKRNEKLTLQYVLFSASDYVKKVDATDSEVKTFYGQHKDQFRLPPTIVLNYVQTKDRALADSLSKTLTVHSDFAKVAKQLKLEVKTSAPFTQEQPILTFASNPDVVPKFFQMKPGEYSPPLEVPDGWQIVQLKEKKDMGVVPPLEEIKDKVKDTVLMEKSFALAKPDADKALKPLQEAVHLGKDFKTAAGGLGLKAEETPAFGRRDYVANTGLIQEFQQEADHLNADKKLSGVISTSQGPAIIYLEKEEKPSNGEFESDKENFKEMLSAERRNQLLIAFISQLRAKADVHSKVKRQ